MPTSYAFTNYLRFLNPTDNGTILSWTGTSPQNGGWSLVDANDDGNLDIGSDYLNSSERTFTGYYYTDSNGNEHPVFSLLDPGAELVYYIPYNSADYNLATELSGPGSTSDQADNFVPQGGPLGPGVYSYTHLMRLTATDSGSELTWSNALNFHTSHTILDQNGDANLDIGVDGNDANTWTFTGYYYTHSDGSEHPIYYPGSGSFYYIPYNRAETELPNEMPESGSTTNFSNNFVPEGGTFCFAAGSLIATPAGEVAVERLRIGDTVQTAEGRAVPVKWIGRQTVSTHFGPAERLMPVRFAAGSLGEGLPHEPLTVTADHGMLVDGVICLAGALVNGTTITRVPLAEMGERYTVYHIETEAHEIILANGAPAETFIDNVSRRVFDNFAEFEALYGDVPEMAELPYPRAMSARQVPGRIRRALSSSRVA
jgi:hypothetical protein